MKITKTRSKSNELTNNKRFANFGCHKCPECGEHKTSIEYISEGVLDKGILTGLCRRGSRGFFKLRTTQVDLYKCLTCGAEWESEEYYTS